MVKKVTSISSKRMEKDFNGFISKIKIDKKTDIPDIEYTLNSDKNEKAVVLRGKEKPLNSFLSAMQNLAEIYCYICDMKEKIDDVTITTVNFSEKGGITIFGLIELKNGIPQPLCVNTPHVLIEDSENQWNLPDYAQKQVAELKEQAILYIRGEVAEKQGEFSFKESLG